MSKKSRILNTILIVFAMIVLLTSCGTVVEDQTSDALESTSMFVQVESTMLWKVVYHRETKVMYVISYGSYNSGDFTLLVNPDGTPMLYDGGK